MYNLYLDKLYLSIFIYSNNRSWWRSLINSLSNFISFIWGVAVSVFVQTPNPKPELRVLVINIWVIKIDWVRGGGGQDWDRSTCQCQSLSPPVHQQHHYLSLLSSLPSHQPDHHHTTVRFLTLRVIRTSSMYYILKIQNSFNSRQKKVYKICII